MAFVRMSWEQLQGKVVETVCRLYYGPALDVVTVAIDGKAAAGKSYWAEQLKQELASHQIDSCILETDWFLISRAEREEKERTQCREVSGHLYIPKDLHYSYWNWDKLRSTLEGVRQKAVSTDGGTLHMEGLYDRAKGECSAKRDIEVAHRSIVIIAGCYVLAQENIDPDFSVLLYVNREIGRARKIQREQEKQAGEFPNGERVGVVVTTWEQIEEPTFFRHLIEHGSKADIVVDTSDLTSMAIVKFSLSGTEEDELEQALKWDQEVAQAEQNADADELYTLGERALSDSDCVRAMAAAGQIRKDEKDFGGASDAFGEALRKSPQSLELMTQKALMLERSGELDDSLTLLNEARALLGEDPALYGWRAEVEGLCGRVYKSKWKEKWWDEEDKDKAQAAQKAENLLSDSLAAYGIAFQMDPTSFYNGDNAAALCELHQHLDLGTPRLIQVENEPAMEYNDIIPATRWAAQAALVGKPDDFWARSTLGNLAVMKGTRVEVIAQYQRALNECRPDSFQIDAVAQQLELFLALEFRDSMCRTALGILRA